MIMPADAPPPAVAAIMAPDQSATSRKPPQGLAESPGTQQGGRPTPAPEPTDGTAGAALFGKLANFYRLDEDFRSIRGTPRQGFPLALKEMPVTSGAWLSLGGDYRLRFDGYRRSNFGLSGSYDYVAIEDRFLVHANLELGDSVRAFVQLGAATEGGRRPGPIPGERSGPDLVQGFVEATPHVAFGTLRLRAGRQEFILGKLFTSREAINFRQAFDGVRLHAGAGGWNLIGFAGRPVANRTGSFDDRTSDTDRVATLSLDHRIVSDLRLQGTFVTRRNERARYAQGAGAETRRSYSARLFGDSGRVSVDAQAIYQDGTFRSTDGRRAAISAWAIAFQTELALPGRYAPRAGLRIDAGSGDADAGDGRLGTLDIPYPGLAYLNDATIFAPRNSRDLQPYLTVRPTATLAVTVGDELLWRNRRGDAVYNPANGAVVPPGGAGSLIANQPYLRMQWRPMPLLSYQVSYVHAARGAVLRNTGATANLDYLSGAMLFRF